MSRWEWLKESLDKNRDTVYGKRYGFCDINSIKQYQKSVPLVEYDDIREYIDLIEEGESDILFRGLPKAFELTSGSTAGAKLIPYTKDSFRDFQRAIIPYLEMLKDDFSVDLNMSYFSISPSFREKKRTNCGIDIGVSDEEYLGIGSNNLVPSWISEITDFKEWKIATIYWLIKAKELQFISIWSPTYLLSIFDAMSEYRDELSSIFEDGGVVDGHNLAPDLLAKERFIEFLDSKNGDNLWRGLKIISLWQDGISRMYAKRLKSYFPSTLFHPKGLISTESIVAMPSKEGLPLLSVDSGFFEFMDDDKIYLADELKKEKEYEVIITTNGGLYRYKTGDIVSFEGYINGASIVRFSHRRGGFSDLVGEKLSESFLIKAFEDIDEFIMFIPDYKERKYIMIVEKSSKLDPLEVQKRLFLNPQYRYARELGQLNEIEIIKIENPLALYMENMLKKKRRFGDIKVPILLIDESRWWQS